MFWTLAFAGVTVKMIFYEVVKFAPRSYELRLRVFTNRPSRKSVALSVRGKTSAAIVKPSNPVCLYAKRTQKSRVELSVFASKMRQFRGCKMVLP